MVSIMSSPAANFTSCSAVAHCFPNAVNFASISLTVLRNRPSGLSFEIQLMVCPFDLCPTRLHDHRHWFPVRLSLGACPSQFGRTSTLRPPHLPHLARRWNDGTLDVAERKIYKDR